MRGLLLLALVLLVATGCSTSPPANGDGAGTPAGETSPNETSTSGEVQGEEEDPTCPKTADAETIPGISAEHLDLEYWLAQNKSLGLDTPIMTPSDIADFNAALANRTWAEPVVEAELRIKLDERLAFMRERITEKKYLNLDGSEVSAAELATFELPAALPAATYDVRVVLETTPVRCGPRNAGLYTESLNPAFDRNNCSTLHPYEPIVVLFDWPGTEMQYVRGPYTSGWIPNTAKLSAAIEPQGPLATAFLTGQDVRVAKDLTTDVAGAKVTIPQGAHLPVSPTDPTKVLVAHKGGVAEVASVADMQSTVRPLTRRDVFTEAFALLNEPYGWGGQDGCRDCSRYLMDIFGSFGLELPRSSGAQAKAGSFSIDVSEIENEQEKLLLIDAAAEQGIVLLRFPGHIMLYLGRDKAGTPMVIHSFAEYVAPCADAESEPDDQDAADASDADGDKAAGADSDGSVADADAKPSPDAKDSASKTPRETLMRVNKITVSDLELGRGSSRTAFIERLTQITVLGTTPGLALSGAAQLREAAPVAVPEGECRDSNAVAIYPSPLRPNEDQPLRIIVTSTENLGPVQLALIGSEGERVVPELKPYGGPPFSYVATIEKPKAGGYKAVFGDGPSVDACLSIRVRERAPKADAVGEVVWDIRRNWSEPTENLFSVFVESLFDYPIEEDLTWTDLHTILQDPERNILHNYYSLDEEDGFKFKPDCADMPYFVRSYFAWKMGLPMGYRRCSRGRAGKPPKCNEELLTNLSEPMRQTPADAFEYFMNRNVAKVHSGCARTAPGDDFTDFYPVPLTRDGVRPGVMYADPDGHLLLVVDWVPQTAKSYGVLLAADAQPDATIGRRRFWRGSFLFTPETTNVGAGFKAFRPIIRDGNVEGGLRALTNDELDEKSGFRPYSEEQYEGSKDDFYDKMAALINPRPLDPIAMQLWLIDALEESVARRVNSVNNGEAWKKKYPSKTIEMPKGYSIFETSGPWEDYSTPSRDLRLLVAMDAVTQFAARVRRAPKRFGIAEAEVDAKIAELEAVRDDALKSRTFTYTRSDDTDWELTLMDVIERSEIFEISYNPNDCVEIRWAASPDTDEYKPCKTFAPKAQRERMDSYRQWFIDRKRPPR